MRSRNGSAASSVRSASASSRWRRKHMIRLASTPSLRPASAMARVRPSTTVANATPRPVWPCGSKNISTWRTLSACAREIGEGKVVEILLGDQHRHALIVDVEEILQVAEPIRLPHRVDRRIRQADAVAARQRKHQLRLEAPLDVNVQLAFGELRDQSVGVMHAKQRRLSDATAIPTVFARARIIRSGEYRQSPPYPAGNPDPRHDLDHDPVAWNPCDLRSSPRKRGPRLRIAGTRLWIPACAGMSGRGASSQTGFAL